LVRLVSVGWRNPPSPPAGLPVAVSGKFDPARPTDVIVVVAGFGTQGYASSTGFLQGLRRAAAPHAPAAASRPAHG
jgi:transcriptional regulator GlxA family with amidase domain